ncbi:2-amino-4-hydroxy-6-hydroxymethyldihydropteridine diphosphokinase [Desulfonatronospira sp.]|uniref:2-amino-4-hydroxy-6- hydroxymethyldihydropteridine diphosphokinase n=1 Tax=Desulfonatronospira sp. TaxID=1962951 RepID=UPI0025BBF4B3|nr:2-amino-4-hydroxy-6-hydroxymethyldihydropteridine diphosphokinase [Desulfonatronospira sp.]
MQDIFVSLGSNKGSPMENLRIAAKLLGDFPGLYSVCKSSVYRTEPQGVKGQPWFANQVLWLRCNEHWQPGRLLLSLKDLERRMGRTPERRHGPRVIDLDILLFGNIVIAEGNLILPHPELKSRAFVLVPLQEICPDLVLPDGSRIGILLEKIGFRLEGNKIFQT